MKPRRVKVKRTHGPRPRSAEEALDDLRRDHAWEAALEALGADDFSEEDLTAVRAEWRAAGLKV